MSEIATLSKIGFEEIFEGDDAARAEFELYCNELDNQAIAAQDAEMVEHEIKKLLDVKMLALVDRLKFQVESLRAENKSLERQREEWKDLHRDASASAMKWMEVYYKHKDGADHMAEVARCEELTTQHLEK